MFLFCKVQRRRRQKEKGKEKEKGDPRNHRTNLRLAIAAEVFARFG